MNALKQRLGSYRAKAAKNGSINWKAARYPKPYFLQKTSLSRSTDGKTLFFDDLSAWPCSDYQDAHDVARLDHTGWFADNFQDGLIRGAVVSFRNPRKINDEYDGEPSHIFYLPATYCTFWDGATVYTDQIFYSAVECARYADQIAEHDAEESRDDDAKFQAELQIEDAKSEIHALNQKTLAVIRELKNGQPLAQYPAICAAVRGHILDALAQRSWLFKRVAALTDNYWLAVEQAP